VKLERQYPWRGSSPGRLPSGHPEGSPIVSGGYVVRHRYPAHRPVRSQGTQASPPLRTILGPWLSGLSRTRSKNC